MQFTVNQRVYEEIVEFEFIKEVAINTFLFCFLLFPLSFIIFIKNIAAMKSELY